MHKIFQEADSKEGLLVDASNAFNSLNRQAVLKNIQAHLSPVCNNFNQHIPSEFLLHISGLVCIYLMLIML